MPQQGQQVPTWVRRAEFVELLRTVGEGETCIPWLWTTKPGYVRISDDEGARVGAHRYVWEQTNGPIPDGMEVCHNCPGPQGDSPSCVRPSHLWLGTHAQNIQDAYAKGRMHGNTKNHAKGENHWGARLTAEDVYRIRRLCDAGAVQNRLAIEYGISRVTIGHIVKRRSWRHLAEESDEPTQTPATQA